MRATPLQGATGEFNSPFGPGQYPLSHTSEIERPRIYQVPDDDDDFDIARSPVALIAIGAIMPGIGGIVAKTGTIETLYITELTGLILIWGGYSSCVWPGNHSEIPRN